MRRRSPAGNPGSIGLRLRDAEHAIAPAVPGRATDPEPHPALLEPMGRMGYAAVTMPPRLVLAGAGHAHVHVAAHARTLTDAGVEVCLVAPGNLWYSGLATGVLGGQYTPDEDQIDPAALIEPAGGRMIRDRVVGLDRKERVVHLEDGGTLTYDAVSFNVGSTVPAGALAPLPEGAFPVKPIADLWRVRTVLEPRLRAGEALDLVVIGGGPTGCEIAANLEALARREGGSARITLLARSGRVLPAHGAAASRSLLSALRRRGIDVRTATTAAHVEPGKVHTEPGGTVPFDLLLLATGLRPPGLVGELGLPTGDAGGLVVDATLRSPADPRVFGAGDCVDLQGHPLPRLGVFGVRQAPVLLHNLAATLLGDRPHRPYRPQRRWLSILNLGDGTALALWGRLHWRGRASMWWKEWLDRRFLERYRNGGVRG